MKPFSLLITKIRNFLSWHFAHFVNIAFFFPEFQVWSVLTSGKYHGAVPRRIKAFMCCYCKLLRCWFIKATQRFRKSRSSCKRDSVYVMIALFLSILCFEELFKGAIDKSLLFQFWRQHFWISALSLLFFCI